MGKKNLKGLKGFSQNICKGIPQKKINMLQEMFLKKGLKDIQNPDKLSPIHPKRVRKISQYAQKTTVFSNTKTDPAKLIIFKNKEAEKGN